MKSTSFDTYRNLYQERWGYEVEGEEFLSEMDRERFFAQEVFFFYLKSLSHSS